MRAERRRATGGSATAWARPWPAPRRGRALGSRRSDRGEPHDLQPHLVYGELFERELPKAGVFVVADPVLDPGVLAVAALEHGDVLVGLVGEVRLEAVAVVVGKRQLRAGGR